MPSNLVIVESPAKAKTIEKILGKDYLVKSSYGHIRDLDKGNKGIDIENNFKLNYKISDDKKDVVKDLKKLSKAADVVWLASDEDREGEAIAWHLYEALGLTKDKTRRIVFQEITPAAINKAVSNPREIDKNLVDAQQARRALDRLVGFELSPLLWRKVKPSLSAGRVQSVTVKLIVEREREIINFTSTPYFRVTAEFLTSNKEILHTELKHRFTTESDATSFLNSISTSQFKVSSTTKSPSKRTPSAPFTTSTLQQEASRKLSFSVSQTMSVAQKLYEAGHITYMRTDSVILSNLALQSAKEEICSSFGSDYHHTRNFITKSKGAQQAHEAIRPTHFDRHRVGNMEQEKRLYDLIWRRAVASQMSDAKLEKSTINISTNTPYIFQATGEVILFDGFLKLYIDSKNDDTTTSSKEDNNLLPSVKEGEELLCKSESMVAVEKFTQKPSRYSEASLVKQLEELGIGRPSTYAPTITTVISRGYVIKESREGVAREYKVLTLKKGVVEHSTKRENSGAEKNKLFPTDIGMVVNDFLEQHFPNILNYSFTADVESQFDKIADGKEQWQNMIKDFYEPFHTNIVETTENSDYANTERFVGIDPETGKDIIARVGRYGPMVQLGSVEDKKYSKLGFGMLIETITLEQALSLFVLPRVVGEYEGLDMTVAIGRFGPYIRHNGVFTSLDKGEDPYTVLVDRCIEMIEAKREKDRNKVIHNFEKNSIQVLNGRYGPYITFEGDNYKIPKGTEANELVLEDCLELISKQKLNPPTTKRRFAAKKSTGGKSSTTTKRTKAKK